jgi:flavorubredoxin
MAKVQETDAGYTENPGYMEMGDGMYCMKECIVSSALAGASREDLPSWYDPGEDLHASQSAYVIVDDETLMFDTWSPASRDTVVDALDEVLDGRDLDYLVISHPESNHAGNLEIILREYPEATLVAPSRGAEHERRLYRLDSWDAEFVEDGDVIDLGDHSVEFVEPTFFDQAMTTYMFERTTRTLFTVDWFGFQHMGSDCLRFVDEMRYDLTEDQLDRFNGYALVWLRFADPEKIDRVIDHVTEELAPEVIAPAHGQVIREDVPRYLEMMRSVLHDIGEQSTDYHIHSHQMTRYGGGEADD